MKRSATIHLELSSETFVETLLKALLPETKKPATSRSKVSIRSEGKKLIMKVEARDTSALRATLNSYLRWAAVVRDTLETAAKLEDQTCENT
jgi:KEOPS complex subunit Pcc1